MFPRRQHKSPGQAPTQQFPTSVLRRSTTHRAGRTEPCTGAPEEQEKDALWGPRLGWSQGLSRMGLREGRHRGGASLESPPLFPSRTPLWLRTGVGGSHSPGVEDLKTGWEEANTNSEPLLLIQGASLALSHIIITTIMGCYSHFRGLSSRGQGLSLGALYLPKKP